MTDPNSKAFPSGDYGHFGLTKREYFAAFIMGAFAVGPDGDEPKGMTVFQHAAELAEGAVIWADALIVALGRGRPQ